MLLYLEEVNSMSKVVVRKNESLDDALRRFKRSAVSYTHLDVYKRQALSLGLTL